MGTIHDAAGRASVVVRRSVREGVTSIIALTVVAVTIWMLASTYVAGGRSLGDAAEPAARAALEAYSRQRDILGVATALLGTVVGYYFGRAPAERLADSSQRNADLAQERERAVKDDARSTVTRIRSRLGDQRATEFRGSPVPNGLREIESEIDGLIARLG